MIIDEDKYIEKLEQDLKLAGWTNSIEANTYYSIMRLSGADCILYINDCLLYTSPSPRDCS